MHDRKTVYAAIDSERDYQDSQSGNARRHPEDPPTMTVAEHILYMEKCLHDAREACYHPDGVVNALCHIRKVTALGVRAMESYGAPFRDRAPPLQ